MFIVFCDIDKLMVKQLCKSISGLETNYARFACSNRITISPMLDLKLLRLMYSMLNVMYENQ